MQVDPPALVLAFAFGLAAGALYLAVLWLSVQRLATSRHPVLGLLAGMGLRLALLLGAFYVVMGGDWQRLLASLAGFLMMRVLVTRWLTVAEPRRPA